MTLRYIVEGKHAATFTATTKVKDRDEAIRKCFSLSLLNQKEGYKKYSTPVLYSNDNQLLERLIIQP